MAHNVLLVMPLKHNEQDARAAQIKKAIQQRADRQGFEVDHIHTVTHAGKAVHEIRKRGRTFYKTVIVSLEVPEMRQFQKKSTVVELLRAQLNGAVKIIPLTDENLQYAKSKDDLKGIVDEVFQSCEISPQASIPGNSVSSVGLILVAVFVALMAGNWRAEPTQKTAIEWYVQVRAAELTPMIQSDRDKYGNQYVLEKIKNGGYRE